MTRDEWKALKKEKGMKVYVLRYEGGAHMTPKCALEYTIDTIYPRAATVRRQVSWAVEYDFFPCEMLHTEQEMKEKWGDLNANRHRGPAYCRYCFYFLHRFDITEVIGMSFEELCFAIVGVVSAFFILAAFIGMLRESKQMDDEIWNHERKEARLQDKIESQESLIRQAKANINLC